MHALKTGLNADKFAIISTENIVLVVDLVLVSKALY